MNKKALGIVSLFALCASSSAMASSSDDVEFIGTITAEQLVKRYCEITATNDGALKALGAVSGNTPKGFTALAGYSADGGTYGSVTVNSGGLSTQLTASNFRLNKGDESYNAANLYSGFGVFPGRGSGDLGSDSVKKVNLNDSEEDQQFDVWFYASQKEDTGTFEVGEYVGITTITCEPRDVSGDVSASAE